MAVLGLDVSVPGAAVAWQAVASGSASGAPAVNGAIVARGWMDADAEELAAAGRCLNGDAQSEVLLEKALQAIEQLSERARHADEQRRRCLEASRCLRGTVRVMARVRPRLEYENEEEDGGCLRVLSRTQLEVLIEPRAQLTEQVRPGSRRRTAGSMHGFGSASRSASALSDAARCGGGHVEHAGYPQQAVPPDPRSARTSFEPRTFFFDMLFDADVTDDEIFMAVHDELEAAVDGEAVCIVAYGATGSGKTHTVTNLAERTAKELERQAASLEKGGMRLEMMVQIVEIYNEQVRDLLARDSQATDTGQSPPRLKLSMSSSSPTLFGATFRSIGGGSSEGIAKSLLETLHMGQAQRATSSTSVHGRSSRSHLVMTLHLSTKDAVTGAHTKTGKLSLVDLAGSERIKRSEATGDRLREAQHINRSLSALADVIWAKERRVGHVPYRNSKLTHLLQDALGGANLCRTVVIVALPPTRAAIGETLHSLQFSSRLNSISLQSVPRRPDANRSRDDPDTLRTEAERLRAENAKMKEQLEDRDRQIEHSNAKLRERERQIADRDRQLAMTRRMLLELSSAEVRSASAPAVLLEEALAASATEHGHFAGSARPPPTSGHGGASHRTALAPGLQECAVQGSVPPVVIRQGSRGTRRSAHASARTSSRHSATPGSSACPSGSRLRSSRSAWDVRSSREGGRGYSPGARAQASFGMLPHPGPHSASGYHAAAQAAIAGRENREVEASGTAACSAPSTPPAAEAPPLLDEARKLPSSAVRLEAARYSGSTGVASTYAPHNTGGSSASRGSGSPCSEPQEGCLEPVRDASTPFLPSWPWKDGGAPAAEEVQSWMPTPAWAQVPSSGGSGRGGATRPSEEVSPDGSPGRGGHTRRTQEARGAARREDPRGAREESPPENASWGRALQVLKPLGSPPPPASSAASSAAAVSCIMVPDDQHGAPTVVELGGGGGASDRPRSSSNSSGRIRQSPREYIVEVLSPQRARELTTDAPWQLHSLQSPTLLLSPGQQEEGGTEGPYGIPRSDSSISLSSDEGDIKDRLRQILRIDRPRGSTPPQASRGSRRTRSPSSVSQPASSASVSHPATPVLSTSARSAAPVGHVGNGALRSQASGSEAAAPSTVASPGGTSLPSAPPTTPALVSQPASHVADFASSKSGSPQMQLATTPLSHQLPQSSQAAATAAAAAAGGYVPPRGILTAPWPGVGTGAGTAPSGVASTVASRRVVGQAAVRGSSSPYSCSPRLHGSSPSSPTMTRGGVDAGRSGMPPPSSCGPSPTRRQPYHQLMSRLPLGPASPSSRHGVR